MVRFYTAALLLLFPLFSSAEDDVLARLDSFFDKHCYECHDDLTSEGDLDLYSLPYDLSDPRNFDQWQHIFERVEMGEMPPSKKNRPHPDELADFAAILESPLITADQIRVATQGRARVRRLNRNEFETSLEDLLHIPLQIEEDLPEDARSHGLDTVGEALNVSSVQIQAYLDAIDESLDRATTLYTRPERHKHTLTFREETGIMQVYRRGGPFLIQDDGVAFFATEKFSHLNATLSQYTAPHTARYRIRVSAYALRSEEPVIVSLRAGGKGHAESSHVPHEFLDHFPVREGEPQVFEWEGWLERGHYLHVYPTSLRPMRFAGKNEFGKQKDYEGPAGVVQWVEVDGPIYDEWPPRSHQALWGDLEMKLGEGMKDEPYLNAHLLEPPEKTAQPRLTEKARDKQTGNKMVYDPAQGVGGEPIHKQVRIPDPIIATHFLVVTQQKKQAEDLLRSFAARAWRHRFSEQEIAPIISLTNRWFDEGSTFQNAVRVGYKAILTSPGFLYHQATLPDSSLALDGPALAERLSFFLTSGLPDEALRKHGAIGALSDPATLRAETERLLDGEDSERFLDHFLAQWLDLRLIDFTVPDEKLYPEFDQLLEWSMVRETTAYIRELIDANLSVSHLIDSDFAMVNWRLARQYDLPAVDGMQVEKVSLPAESVRGGLLTQGSILKVTANGTTTSPVVRGVWLMERIMGDYPSPPPPGIPAIEPDIRGAVSVREQLEAHRNSESCASCHQTIDPLGVALESFDVIGGFRDTYRALNPDLVDMRPRFGPKGPPPTRYQTGLPVDAGDIMPDGSRYEDIEEFKAILLENPRKLARGLTEKLIVYATGADISFGDRPEIEAILDRAEASDYGFRTLIHEVIQSPLFHQK